MALVVAVVLVELRGVNSKILSFGTAAPVKIVGYVTSVHSLLSDDTKTGNDPAQCP